MSELTEEQKKALEEQKAQCPFCQIVQGKIAAKIVFEDDKVLAILDINPANKGHTLVMPKEHYPIMPLIPKDVFQHTFKIVNEMSKSIRKALVSEGSSIFIANGGVAGQQSGHFMVHVIPRDKGDNVGIELKKGKVDSKKIDELEGMLKHNLPLMLREFLAAHPLPGQQVPSTTLGKEEVIEIIKKNPKVVELIKTNPDAFRKVIPTNEQLKALFVNVDVEDVIEAFSEKVEIEESKELKNIKKKEQKSPKKKKVTKKKATKKKKESNLDDIARLFG